MNEKKTFILGAAFPRMANPKLTRKFSSIIGAAILKLKIKIFPMKIESSDKFCIRNEVSKSRIW